MPDDPATIFDKKYGRGGATETAPVSPAAAFDAKYAAPEATSVKSVREGIFGPTPDYSQQPPVLSGAFRGAPPEPSRTVGDKALDTVADVGWGIIEGTTQAADTFGRMGRGLVDVANEGVKAAFGRGFDLGEATDRPVTGLADPLMAKAGQTRTLDDARTDARAEGHGTAMDVGGKIGEKGAGLIAMMAGAKPVGAGLAKVGVTGSLNNVLSFAGGSILTDPKHPLSAGISGALQGIGGEMGSALVKNTAAAVLARWAGQNGERAAHVIQGLGFGTGMAASPTVDPDGNLHNVLMDSDVLGSVETILLPALLHAGASRESVRHAVESLRSDAAKVAADPVRDEPTNVTLWRGRMREAEAEGQRLREQAKAEAAADAAAQPNMDPTPGEPVAVTLERGRRRVEAAQAAPEAPAGFSADLFHGSPVTDLRSVRANPESRQYDNATSQLGAFFAPSEAEASRYSGKGGKVYPAKVSLQRPYEMPWSEFNKFQSPDKGPDGKSIGDWSEGGLARRAEALKAEASALRKELEAAGYDGIIVKSTRGKLLEVASFKDVALPEAPAAPREEVIQPRAGEPTAPKVKASERGGIDPDIIPETAKGAKNVIERETASFIQRVRSTGGEAAKEVAAKAEATVDATKRNLGEMSAELDTALESSGGAPFTAKGKAASNLSRPVPVEGKAYFRSRFLEGLEGKAEAKTPEEQAILEAGRGLTDKLGRMAVERGVKQYDPRAGEMEQAYEAPAAPGESVAPNPVRGARSPLLPIAERTGLSGVEATDPTNRPGFGRSTGSGRAGEDPFGLVPSGEAMPGVGGVVPGEAGSARRVPTDPLNSAARDVSLPGVESVERGIPRIPVARRPGGNATDPLVPESVGRDMPGVEPVPSRMTEAGNVDVPSPSGWAPFNYIPGGKVAPRIMAPEMIDVMVEGPKSPLWKKVIDAFADINGIDRTVVERDFLARNEEMSGIKGPEAQTKRTHVEFRRSYRNVPSAIRHNGQIIDLFESNPSTYFRRLAETRAARYGVIEHFGQDIPQSKPMGATGQGAVLGGSAQAPEKPKETLSQLRERYAKETNRDEDFTALMRGLHGQQIRRAVVPPGSVRAQVAHGANLVLKGIKTLNLSASAVQNIPESLGSTMSFTGIPILAKRVLGMVTQSKSWKDMKAFAETQGAVTRDVLNMSYDPTRPFASSMRIFSEVGRRAFGHGPINEAQESLAAVGARDVANLLKAGKGKEIHAQRLMATGMEEGLARRLAEGKGTEAEYDAMVRKAPGQLVGANLSRVEQSNWENRRVTKALTAFHRYAWMTARGAANQASAYLKTMNGVITDSSLTPKQRWQRSIAAHRQFGGYMAGKSLQGSTAYMLSALAFGGTTGLKIAWNEAKDDPVSFAWQSFVYSTVGGPFAAIQRTLSDKGNLEDAVYPWFMTKELFGLASGSGPRYKDKNFAERLGQFATRTIPATRIFETALAATGLGSPEAHAIETSKRAFFRWRYSLPRKGTFIPGDDTVGADYRANIRRAYQSVVDHDTPEEVNEHVMKALGIKGKDKYDVAESVLRKRLLTPASLGVSKGEAKAMLDALKERIGEDAYKNLETHDTLLDRLAESIKRGK